MQTVAELIKQLEKLPEEMTLGPCIDQYICVNLSEGCLDVQHPWERDGDKNVYVWLRQMPEEVPIDLFERAAQVGQSRNLFREWAINEDVKQGMRPPPPDLPPSTKPVHD